MTSIFEGQPPPKKNKDLFQPTTRGHLHPILGYGTDQIQALARRFVDLASLELDKHLGWCFCPAGGGAKKKRGEVIK